ncbi:MAG: ThiF family adenylyltransferase [Candidatus Nanoarchaeia archaeon]|nr:ThiF family adenylyltransferase [Candidatus Nanoarchaeia archaeon]MDD5740521.1 ThiF family adenylyltransferase [Candidatus Nanoarchaeia archaeon]
MRYAKQELAKGWKQENLQNSHIVVTGSNNLASFILADLTAMGFGKITRIGENSLQFLDFYNMNPDTEFEEIQGEVLNEELAKDYIGKPDFFVDASEGREKQICIGYAIKNSIQAISASCSKESYKIKVIKKNESLDEIINFHKNEKNNGIINAIIASGITADEIRKRIMPLPDDKTLSRLSASNLEDKINKKVLLVGAGAIGTFAGIGLAMAGADVDVIDFDNVEESNLNRQILFYNSVGKYKAEVMAEKLSKLGNFKGIVRKVDENYKLEKYYEIILSCVDNAKARYYLDWLSYKTKTPLLNSGTSFIQGSVMPYIPGKTACLDCQGFGMLSQTKDKEEVGSCYEPTTIISNQITGALLVNQINKMHEDTATIKYNSNRGIEKVLTLRNCLAGCEKNGEK